MSSIVTNLPIRSFPTRRSSDLDDPEWSLDFARRGIPGRFEVAPLACGNAKSEGRTRSEEHTSELQSHHDLVCRLLLEKKKEKSDCKRIRIRPSGHKSPDRSAGS